MNQVFLCGKVTFVTKKETEDDVITRFGLTTTCEYTNKDGGKVTEISNHICEVKDSVWKTYSLIQYGAELRVFGRIRYISHYGKYGEVLNTRTEIECLAIGENR